MIRGLAALLAFMSWAGSALAVTPSVRVVEPRAFGYFIGDVLTREVAIDVAADARIDPASIPRPGPLNYWLELKSVDLEETSRSNQRHYTMRLAYQTFYAPLEPRKLQIPTIRLRILQPHGESEQAVVPSWSFISSPIREIIPEKSEGEGQVHFLRADVPVALSSTATERTSMAIAGGVALAALILFAHHLAIWPFHRRRQRPFTRALRVVRREAAKEPQAGDYRLALLTLHRAFDDAAHHRMLAADLDQFLIAHPEFERLRSDITRFFEKSRQAFFADDMLGTRAQLPLSELAAFATALSERERAAG